MLFIIIKSGVREFFPACTAKLLVLGSFFLDKKKEVSKLLYLIYCISCEHFLANLDLFFKLFLIAV